MASPNHELILVGPSTNDTEASIHDPNTNESSDDVRRSTPAPECVDYPGQLVEVVQDAESSSSLPELGRRGTPINTATAAPDPMMAIVPMDIGTSTGRSTSSSSITGQGTRSASPPATVYKLLPPVIVSPNGVLLAPLRDRLSSKNPHVLERPDRLDRAETSTERPTRRTRVTISEETKEAGNSSGSSSEDKQPPPEPPKRRKRGRPPKPKVQKVAPVVVPDDGECSSSSVHDISGDKNDNDQQDDPCSSGPSSPASPSPSKVCKKNCLRNCSKGDLDGFRDVLSMLDKETLRKIQMDLILTGVRARPVQRRSIKARTSETVARRGSLVYSLVIDHKTVDMCKKCFMDMTGISAGVLRKCLSHLLEHQVTGDISELHKIGQSNRGKHAPAHKLKIDVMEQITRHIETFPRDKSYYPTPEGAKGREFITNDTSISQMCSLYNESVTEESHKVSYATYRRVLVEKFNIGFKSTSSMHLCALCQKLDARLKDMDNPDRETVQLTKDLHQAEAKNRQNNKEADKQFAMQDHTTKVLAVDLQKTLPAPMLRSNEAIYRRHLAVYSYTVCDVASGQMACYLWDESIAGRGKMEISSCLKNFIDYTMAQSPDTRTVIVWSDNWLCPNKNLALSAMLMQLSARYNIKIIQKFLVAGHTQNECDAFHSRIEVQRKKETEILLPADWCSVLHRADSKVAVVQMMPYSFFDFSVLIEGPEAPLEQKPAGLEGVAWAKAVSLTYTGCRVDILTHKYETVTVNFERSKERLLTTYPPVLARRISVSPAKKTDCVYLMREKPEMCKQFYEGLETADVDDGVDPASEERVFGEKIDEDKV